MEEQVTTLVNEVLRPLITADGGGVELVSVSDQAIVLRLSRACIGCPGVHYTRTHVIEPLLRTVVGTGVRIELERPPPAPPGGA